MAFNFPDLPVVDDVFVPVAGTAFKWTGQYWLRTADSLYRGLWQVAPNLPDLTGTAHEDGAWYSCETSDPLVPETAPAGVLGIAGTLVGHGDRIDWDSTLQVWVKSTNLSPFVRKTGDVMTGALRLSFDPTQLDEAVRLQYLNLRMAAPLYLGEWQVAANIPNLSGQQRANSYYLARTVDPAVPEQAPVAAPGLVGLTIADGDIVVFNGLTTLFEHMPMGGGTVLPYVKISGDTMTGPLQFPTPDPTTPTQGTHKAYVDRIVATSMLYQGIWQVAANIPDLNVPPNAPLNGYSWIAQTVDPNVAEVAAATIPGIGGATVAALDTIRWNEALALYEHIRGPAAISQMVIADAPPVGAFHGQSWWDSDSGRQYVWFDDGSSQQWVQVSGGGGGAAISSMVPVGDTPPAGATQGMLWFDSANGALFVYYDDGTSAQWVEVGPP